ncbi:hypothetical protein RHSIM_Rhsim07G0041100 [Rhododendron simsii]|uniref:Uncharacterized protein n=1 Tax=Rhododendron simsii TaxID=118357 RepID=A0A834LJV1_RHOSS|nr:hypothetical protein RHSIM_Rhsim07G0041100 [Rhododendron simsii]
MREANLPTTVESVQLPPKKFKPQSPSLRDVELVFDNDQLLDEKSLLQLSHDAFKLAEIELSFINKDLHTKTVTPHLDGNPVACIMTLLLISAAPFQFYRDNDGCREEAWKLKRTVISEPVSESLKDKTYTELRTRSKLGQNIEIATKISILNGDASESVPFDACKLAKQLSEFNADKQWSLMSGVWMELLAYAAFHAKGTDHAH